MNLSVQILAKIPNKLLSNSVPTGFGKKYNFKVKNLFIDKQNRTN